jgi:hypothetical protein
LEEARLNCQIRHDDARMKTTDGKQESMLCSKASVKSKSPRQLAGPNVFSVHDLVLVTLSRCTASVVTYEPGFTRAIVGFVASERLNQGRHDESSYDIVLGMMNRSPL